ncbi:MAG: bifunctional sugar-1-phosphate nucleotidylyltransferase/acetyltransferase [Candidatus Acidifodinimicrobium sp.]
MAGEVKAFIMAAGVGSRLFPFTVNRAKAMIPILNKPLLQFGLEELKAAGIRDVTILVKSGKEGIIKYFGDGKKFGLKIRYIEQKENLGTADAIKYARDLEDGFLALSGDTLFFHEDIEGLVKEYVRNKPDAVMAITEKEDVKPFGSVSFEGNKLIGIKEKTEEGRGFINAGMYMLSKGIFEAIDKVERRENGEYFLTDALMKLKNVKVYKMKKLWIDVGYPWEILNATEALIKTIKTKNQGKVEKATIKGNIVVGKGTVIRSGTYIEGPVIIGERCEIGPNAYIRPNTVIGDDCKVGNACEVKNSVIMNGTKVPHLSYVGDSVIDEGCNLGAGTITANLRFDKADIKVLVKGKLENSRRKKLGAFIGAGVQTGVNVSINPGIIISPNSRILPGETIRRNV